MSPLPELNLNLGMSKERESENDSQDEIIVRTDSAMKKHIITLVISDQEAGKISLKINDKELEVPTYKLTVTDDKTGETNAYQITRDTLSFVTSKTKKSFLSFFGFKRFDTNSYLYENIPFEPQVEYLEKFDIPRHRKLSQDALTYEFSNGGQSVLLYAGDLNEFKLPKEISQYFVVADKDQGKSFIGDILYREKFLKLTPKVELQIIKRKKIPKNFEYDDKGHIKKVIYL
ncbi:hypothetical protein [Chryseobacterium aquaticum]|uniref:hypothetical protein n=1 Tax=Chryseobacterium aquaticum TaxID=452084 RepID=UPI002FC64121